MGLNTRLEEQPKTRPLLTQTSTKYIHTYIQQAYKLKQGKYIELISQLQRMYKGFKYNVIIITVGCLGAIPVNLKQNVLEVGIEEDKIQTVTHRIHRAALLGTIRIRKTILNM